jgi:hypothetical protein
MPGETRSAASVTDPSLLRAASAGADWRCPFCRADNTALVPACKQCGATRGTTPANVVPARQPAKALSARPRSGLPTLAWLLPVVLVGACLVTGLGGLVLMASRPAPAPYVAPTESILGAHVESRAWRMTRIAMRHRLVPQEGFAEQQPVDAVDVFPDGVRHHHDDQVEDGTETQTYTEDVPYQDTETYTEMVACGEDCTTIPETCTEHCTDDGNGFATCTEDCSGGGQSCTPRTCPETRTRPITRTRPEIRTRIVPRYRTVPRDAPWFRWRAWAWVEDRRAEHTGEADAPTAPSDEELGTGAPLGEGEEERIDESASYTVTLRDDRGQTEVVFPSSPEELERYPVGRAVRVLLSPYGSFERVLDDVDGG